MKSKTANQLIDDLVDIVSKNGNLLLNVGPKADGTIAKDQKKVLLEIGD
ncbi:alpha-L-fucosidase [Aureibaculum sp. 2210JD6-5]|nr:alpha-L-fucosidase [Aureibaculum sp. 2210JD6-5]MDY7396907.1 alpha-L-fucosidase [Aureibaculum sp. 2210JD6-5]